MADQLSEQDVQDLGQIRRQLPQGDPRTAKIDALIKSYGSVMQQQAQQAQPQSQEPAPLPIGQPSSKPLTGLGVALGGPVGGALLGDPAARATLGREVKATGSTIAGMPKAIYQSFTQPPQTPQEVSAVGQNPGILKMFGLGLARNISAPIQNAAEWYKQEFQHPTPNATTGEKALSVAPEAMGVAAGNVIASKGSEAAVKGVLRLPSATKASIQQSRVAATQATLPEAANLPPSAVAGAEDIFRASAPTGNNPGFRSNVYAAAPDLAEIGRKANLAEAKGGIVAPDMRVRATVNAINDHLSDMYQTERVPQIQRNAEVPIQLAPGPDAATGMEYLSRNAGEASDRALAAKALQQPTITLAEADKLARVTNKELLGFESMTPAERAGTEATSRKLSGLKDLDRTLGAKINEGLEQRGETGLKPYERRYAALSEIRDQLQKRQNVVELEQPGIVKKIARPIASALTGGKTGIASASQAAVADVNVGRRLQVGLNKLAGSGLQPNRMGAAPMRSPLKMLTGGAIQMPPVPDTSGSAPYSPPAWSPMTRAQRLGLLLQEPQTARPMGSAMEPIDTSPTGVLDAIRRTVRDPKTGRMKVQYMTGTKGQN